MSTELREECFKALTCLYIAVDKHVADDVNEKVKAYIEALEAASSPDRKLKKSQDFMLRTLAAILINAGGEIIVTNDDLGNAHLLEDPMVLTWCDLEDLTFHIKLKKSLTAGM